MNDRVRAQALFLHANGFPTGVYRRFLSALGESVNLHTLPIIQTPRQLEPAKRWPRMTDAVIHEARRIARQHGPVCLIGHSMGGYLALLAGARLANDMAGAVLIDSPLVTGWRSPLFILLKSLGLTKVGGPARIAARRRDHWPSSDHARAHLADKPFIRRWAPEVLNDFITHGLTPESATPAPTTPVTLAIARHVERDIYAHLPARESLAAFRRLRQAGKPVFAVAGRFSRETDLAGRESNRRMFGDRWIELPAGHLVPMEQPEACARAVIDCLGLCQDAASPT